MSQEPKNAYFLLDSRGAPLAHGQLIGSPDAPMLQVRVEDDEIGLVLEHDEIQMISLSDGGAALLGRIVRSRNDMIFLEKLQNVSSDMRQNLRMPTRFKSLIYPCTGRWRGRREIRGKDLSCGGVAFFCTGALEVGEELEVVIPITSQPLILRCKILRVRPPEQEGETALYAAKFVEMCHDEEMVVREAVFNVQLQERPRRAAGDSL